MVRTVAVDVATSPRCLVAEERSFAKSFVRVSCEASTPSHWYVAGEDGWLAIEELIATANQRGHCRTLELALEIVATINEKRFAFSDDELRIRANRGHFVAGIALKLESQSPRRVAARQTDHPSIGSRNNAS